MPIAPPLLDAMVAAAIDAGRVIMRIYGGEATVDRKADGSPTTEADRLAEALILDRLARVAPCVPVLAEESSAGADPDLGREFFLVDPLDGTREFISRNGEFTVNIALVRDRRPVHGVVCAPALSRIYAGGEGVGAFRAAIGETGAGQRQAIRARTVPQSRLVAVASRSHRNAETDEFLKSLDVAEFVAAGSSLKFCRLAEGSADVYPRFGRTMEWDTAAGQAVLEAAGGRVLVHPEGEPLSYGKRESGYDNPHFIAWGARGPAAPANSL